MSTDRKWAVLLKIQKLRWVAGSWCRPRAQGRPLFCQKFQPSENKATNMKNLETIGKAIALKQVKE